MEVPFVDLTLQYQSIRDEIDRAVQSVFGGGQFIGGKSVAEFESRWAAIHKAKYAVGVGNGTDALLIALKAMGVAPGDEIITPAFGWISASEMITLAGARPVFADVLADTCTLDPVAVESKITSRTRGVVLQHLFGQAGHARELQTICKKNNLFLLEDCAQAHLTEEFGVPVGTIGDMGTFSFYPTKNLGAYGDAGCVVSHRADLEQKTRKYANHGGLNEHLIEGINSRLDELHAAVLSVKLNHLQEWTNQRTAHAREYDEQLAGIGEIRPPAVRSETRHTFHLYVVQTARREALRDFLRENGIQTLIHYPSALPGLPAYAYLRHVPGDFPNAHNCSQQVLSLPIYAELTRGQIGYICDRIKMFYAS